MSKVLFLDIDDVLNSNFWNDSHQTEISDGTLIDAEKIELLAELLAKENLSISGVTPDLTTEEIRKTKKFSLVKADEILLWISLHNNVTGWVVLDDLDLHNEQIRQHQVKTDQTTGLTPEDVKQAVKILTGNLKL